ncbi:hypothetical protein NLU13_3703 [Sarocladium strictum]|uniref:Uncharacterized protein n=1 Tax=Sarocladium strictum TaxID=5046 RepID=A0AA39GMJ1_SARSR|nr:hypothetical protein NLU13_3703 [Sarocladium strictum]
MRQRPYCDSSPDLHYTVRRITYKTFTRTQAKSGQVKRENMGLFSSKKSDGSSSNPPAEKKEGWYARYQNSKRGEIRDEDLQKYLGKSKEEIMAWAEHEPGVGKNRHAGTLAAGNAPGIGGVSAAEGMGGWGHSAGSKDRAGGLKFPPKRPEKGGGVDDDEKTLV